MFRFQDDDLFALGLAELFNFVNTGQCDGAIVSLFWPFDGDRYKPLFSRVSLSLPNLKAGRGGWPQSWPSSTKQVHRALRRALQDQLTRVVEDEKSIPPTWPGWTQRSFMRLSPVEAATVTAMRCAFDDVLRSTVQSGTRIDRCKLCEGFYQTGGTAGRPPHFCTPEHRGDYRDTKVFKKTQADRARKRRAIDKERHAKIAEAVAKKPIQKSHI